MMNPVTAMWINWALTAALGGFSAYSASNGHIDPATLSAAIVTALNGVMHGVSTSQPGPMGK